MRRALPSAFLVWVLLCLVARAQELSFTNDGLKISEGSMGDFILAWPDLQTRDGQSSKIVTRTAAGTTSLVIYDDGAVLSGAIAHGGEVTYSFSKLPPGAARIRSQMLIGFAYQQGGHWSFDDAAPQAFPVEKPPQPHLFGNHAGKFELSSYDSRKLDFAFPNYAWLELTDNREWNWPTYALTLSLDLNHDDPRYQVTIRSGSGASGAETAPLVDALGQIDAGDWPGKVKSVDELKSDPEADDAYYNGFKTPAFDSYGGLPDSGAKLGLKRTGYFHVEKMGDKWALVDPEGNLFFHLGICAMGPGDDYTLIPGRESAFAWIPPKDGPFKDAWLKDQDGRVASFYVANYIRKYGYYDFDGFQERMINRVRKFGFNSIGAFSQTSGEAVRKQNISYVAHLPLDPWSAGIHEIPGIRETWDPYDPSNAAKVDAAFAKLADRATQSNLIGYYLVNEPAYEDVPKVVPGLKGSENACKRALVDLLRAKYPTIDACNVAWGMSAKSFDDLNDAPLAVTTRAASEDVETFTGQFFDTYFRLVRDTFRRYDTKHMLIGCRLQPGTINNEQLCRVAGKYLDVMSFNYYTDAVDKDFLNRIYTWTGRPMFLSEFYWSAGAESGLAGGREVATQRDRGLAYRNYVEQTASLGYVVGIEWFTLIDQAATGRWFEGMSGERANTGLFSVADRPWKAALEEMKKTNDAIYDVELGNRAPFAFDNPQFAAAGNTKKTANAPRAIAP
jgi:hypothetical protein